ncbi:TetR family transcriptional regulator C-terminal domain-containing protein [Agarivorans aestuarii]|uniref:TetR family transcriptional regulator C-terminal domain-containing protein n=1 Tax=Agarivorans aestuarii TaxID=1563703 RepID=A0ABU7G2D6_9ALTE|nr:MULTISPECIES: TetR family transcriptional regulator C-terminal domain-containing protein [Agarivorans]MEE1673523.1 TetR family transcriptional regulator C-terminal domain-containing protein [Agarivorans aestuarii]
MKTPPNGKAKRRKLADIRKDNLKQILEVAENLFAQNGYSATTIAAIAAEANLPKANVLYYFKTKEALYKGVLSQLLVVWMSHMDEMTADNHPKLALRQYILQKMTLSKEHPNASRIFAAEILHGAPYLREQLATELKQQFDKTCQVFREWIAKQWMDPINPEHLLFMIWSSTQAYADYAVQSSMMMDKEKLEESDYEEGVEFLTRMVLKGCGVKLF